MRNLAFRKQTCNADFLIFHTRKTGFVTSQHRASMGWIVTGITRIFKRIFKKM